MQRTPLVLTTMQSYHTHGTLLGILSVCLVAHHHSPQGHRHLPHSVHALLLPPVPERPSKLLQPQPAPYVAVHLRLAGNSGEDSIDFQNGVSSDLKQASEMARHQLHAPAFSAMRLQSFLATLCSAPSIKAHACPQALGSTQRLLF